AIYTYSNGFCQHQSEPLLKFIIDVNDETHFVDERLVESVDYYFKTSYSTEIIDIDPHLPKDKLPFHFRNNTQEVISWQNVLKKYRSKIIGINLADEGLYSFQVKEGPRKVIVCTWSHHCCKKGIYVP